MDVLNLLYVLFEFQFSIKLAFLISLAHVWINYKKLYKYQIHFQNLSHGKSFPDLEIMLQGRCCFI